jgi:hypothetical protein
VLRPIRSITRVRGMGSPINDRSTAAVMVKLVV